MRHQRARGAGGRGLGTQFGADVASCAGLVFGHHRLAPVLLHLAAEHPREYVRSAAGSKRHDDPHGLGREGLRLRKRRGNKGSEAQKSDF